MKTEKRVPEFNPNRIIADLQQLVKDWKKDDLRKYRVTSISAEEAPTKKPEEILAIRQKIMRMSRGAFARVLNVPIGTLRSWETGRRNPSGAALRLIEVLERSPEVIRCFAVKKDNNEALRTIVKVACSFGCELTFQLRPSETSRWLPYNTQTPLPLITLSGSESKRGDRSTTEERFAESLDEDIAIAA